MGISLPTRVALWSRSGGQCAICRIELVHEGEVGDPALIGEAAHIVASSDQGPRANPEFEEEERDQFHNLVLLCRNDHRLVDRQPEVYTAEKLLVIKTEHEAWVRSRLSPDDREKHRADIAYATIVEEWARRAHLENWRAWTSNCLSTDPTIWKDVFHDLDELGAWLLGRIWPKRYGDLEDAIENFRRVLQAFLRHFSEYRKEAPDLYYVARFYQIDEWNDDRYHRLLNEYERHISILHDLVLELTRAANLVTDRVRDHIDPSYRLESGALLVEYMTSIVDPVKILRVEYDGAERQGIPFRGLAVFEQDRLERKFSFGQFDSEDHNGEQTD